MDTMLRDAGGAGASADQEAADKKPRAWGRILLVDNEAHARDAAADLLRAQGYSVETAPDGNAARLELEQLTPDLLLTNLQLPDLDGLALLHKAQTLDPDVVAVVFGAGDAKDASLRALRAGAADYLTMPLDTEQLLMVVARALEQRRLRAETGQLRQRLAQRERIENIVGTSAPMKRVFETILQAAAMRAPVLIVGESGTGKGLVATAIHQHSARAHGPFTTLHCAALADTVLERELFGPEGVRGGSLHQAHGGTLFLDEVAVVSASTQAKLLRFLQRADPTGDMDVRILAATARDLSAEVRAGRFREDLCQRLNALTIELPPLRARESDIPLLAARFIQRFARDNAKDVRGFSEEALERLMQYSWPGNVRELEHAVERAVVVCRHHDIRAQDLSPHITKTSGPGEDKLPVVPGASLAELERYAILKTLEHTNGSTSRAAAILGISPRTIQYRLHEYAQARSQRAGKRGKAADEQASSDD